MNMPARKHKSFSSTPLPDNFHVSNHPLIIHKLALMRSRATTSQQFYTLMKEIGMLLTYEITCKFETKPIDDSQYDRAFAGKKPALVPILRSGLALAEGMREVMPSVRTGHLGLLQDKTHRPKEYLVALPEIEGRNFILLDAVIATGNVAIRAVEILIENDVLEENILIGVVLASDEGVRKITDRFKRIDIYAAAIEEFDKSTKQLKPGFGDTGDRLFFGTKDIVTTNVDGGIQ